MTNTNTEVRNDLHLWRVFHPGDEVVTALATMPTRERRKVSPELKAQVLYRYKTDPAATPTSLSREYGIHRNTIHRWLEAMKRFSSQGSAPLRVTSPVPHLLPKAIEVTRPQRLCHLGCGAAMPDPLTDEWIQEHLDVHHPALHQGPSPKSPHGLNQGHAGRPWYECDQCGGQFEYLRRGGTCRKCEEQVSG